MRLVVTADDTTGALETAAACADLGWRAVVRPATARTSPVAGDPVDDASRVRSGDRPGDPAGRDRSGADGREPRHVGPDGAGPSDGGRSDAGPEHAGPGDAGSRDAGPDDAGADEVVVLDLRSRHLPADEAAARVRSIAESGDAHRAHKIDSTLRGNWAAELQAVAHAGRPVLLVPAFPAAGRTCVDGRVLVDGVPVHQTAFGADPRSPVVSSRPLDVLRGAVGAADAAAVRTAFAEGHRIVVADAVSDDDLDRHAALVAAHPEVVLAGPAAVVTALARRLRRGDVPASTARGAGVAAPRSDGRTMHGGDATGGDATGGDATGGEATGGEATGREAIGVDRVAPAGASATRSVLVVSASQHPAAVAQFDALREFAGGAMCAPDGPTPRVAGPAEASGAAETSTGVAVHLVRPPAGADPSDPDRVLAELASDAHARLDADPDIDTLVLVGGDTAAAVLGPAAVHVEGTLGVGIALGRAVVGGRSVRVVTKPGGFGDPGTLVAVIQDVRSR